MSRLPPGLDAGGIASLAGLLRGRAQHYRSTAADVLAVRNRAAGWWTGDAADQYKNHAEWRARALDAMVDATATAADAAAVYAQAISTAVAAYEDAEANLRVAETYGNVAAAWRWELRCGEIVDGLEDAAEAFAAAVNDRFAADTAWFGLFDDGDDLDALAARRDADLAVWDRMLERHSRSDVELGLVDGVPARILPPPPDPTTLPTSTDQANTSIGTTFAPVSVVKVGFKFGGAATIKRFENGVVEIELETRAGVVAGTGEFDGEASTALLHRYLFPDEATAQRFIDRLGQREVRWSRRNADNARLDGMQFEDEFGRYRTAVGNPRSLKVGRDGPYLDLEGATTSSTETDPRSDERTTIEKVEGKARVNVRGVGLGVEVDAEIRDTRTSTNEQKQFEITYSAHSKEGAVLETDVLKQLGAERNPRLGPVLDRVKVGAEENVGQYGRVNIKVDQTTPEGRELAERLRAAAAAGRMPDAETLRRARELGAVRVETGVFTDSSTKGEVSSMGRTPGVIAESSTRSYRPLYRTPAPTPVTVPTP